MAATVEQKLIALTRRCREAAERDADLGRFCAKVLRALTDTDIGPTISPQDKLALLARYVTLRQALLGIGEQGYSTPGGAQQTLEVWLPEDLQTWEPEPEEYQEGLI